MKTLSFQVPSITLVFLMYNEAENIGPVLEEAIAWCEGSLDDWEILVVDDGSTDGSGDIVAQVASTESRVRLVRHETNQGMGAGMRTGLAAVQTDYFVYFPADGQLAPAELDKMIPLLAGGDIVLSVYPHRHSTFGRAILSRAFRDYMTAAANIRFQLEGLYLYPTEPARAIMPLVTGKTFFFSFDLIQRGIESGLTTVLTTINVRPRRTGTSKVTGSFRILEVAREVWAYRQRRRTE